MILLSIFMYPSQHQWEQMYVPPTTLPRTQRTLSISKAMNHSTCPCSQEHHFAKPSIPWSFQATAHMILEITGCWWLTEVSLESHITAQRLSTAGHGSAHLWSQHPGCWARWPWVWGKPELHSETVPQNTSPQHTNIPCDVYCELESSNCLFCLFLKPN